MPAVDFLAWVLRQSLPYQTRTAAETEAVVGLIAGGLVVGAGGGGATVVALTPQGHQAMYLWRAASLQSLSSPPDVIRPARTQAQPGHHSLQPASR